LAVSAVNHLTITVTQHADSTALCVFIMLHCCVLQVTVTYTAWQCITIMLHCCVLQVTVIYTAWQCITIMFCAEGQSSNSCSASYFRSYQYNLPPKTCTVQFHTVSNSSGRLINAKPSAASEFSDTFSLHLATHRYIRNSCTDRLIKREKCCVETEWLIDRSALRDGNVTFSGEIVGTVNRLYIGL
jgi:hypothetical protein